MKGQRKFQLLIADIRDALVDVARANRYGDLFHATWELVRFEDELAGDIGRVRELIAVARDIRNATGPGRSVAEQKIMDTLKGIAWTCCSVLEEADVPRIPDLATATGALNVLVETGEISDMEALDRLDDWKDKHNRR
jgi:hypothetical protein